MELRKACSDWTGNVTARDMMTDEDDAYYRERMLADDLEDTEEEAVGVWRELWPPEGGDWRDEWSILPLQTRGLEGSLNIQNLMVG